MVSLTDRDLDELMEDWFERDGETFTKISSKGRIGWEGTLEKDDAYSTYFLEAPTLPDLIKRAYGLAKDMIVVMNPPMKVTIRIGGEGSATDGKTLYVATKMFDDKEISNGEKLDVFLGCTIHEGCHLLYTDMSYISRIKNGLTKTLWNIIEDERVEQILAYDKPGLARFIEKTKYYYFDKFYLDHIKDKELNEIEKIVGIFLRIIRYPKYLIEDDFVYFGGYLKRIKDVVMPYPVTTRQSIECAEKVYEILKDLYTEKEKEKKEKESEEGSPDGAGSDSSDSSESEKTDEMSAKEMEKAFEKFKDALEKELSKPATGAKLDSEDKSDAVKRDSTIAGTCEGTFEKGVGRETYFVKAPDCKDMYMRSYDRIKRFIPSISKIVKGHCKEYKLIHRSMRSGVLDTNKLAEAVQGVPTVYLREGEVVTDKVSVCVLIDESGSMGGTRITAARDTAVLLNEALGNIPQVELFIYGHTGDIRTSSSTELSIYRENGHHLKYALGSVVARSENRDGIAILEAATRVRKQTKNPVLMFVISDGSPSAGNYRGDSAQKHTKECVQKVEKMGYSVVQVCISSTYNPATMFRHFVILEDMSRLAFDLGRVIKKATLAAAKVHTR